MRQYTPSPGKSIARAAETLIMRRLRSGPASLADVTSHGRIHGIPPSLTRAAIDRMAAAGTITIAVRGGEILVSRRATR